MDANARNELAAIKRELNAIISELESISSGVRRDFVGIGSDKCSDCINNVVRQYYTAKRKLDNLDTSAIREGFGK